MGFNSVLNSIRKRHLGFPFSTSAPTIPNLETIIHTVLVLLIRLIMLNISSKHTNNISSKHTNNITGNARSAVQCRGRGRACYVSLELL